LSIVNVTKLNFRNTPTPIGRGRLRISVAKPLHWHLACAGTVRYAALPGEGLAAPAHTEMADFCIAAYRAELGC